MSVGPLLASLPSWFSAYLIPITLYSQPSFMSSAPYQALPNDDYDEDQTPSRRGHDAEHIQLSQDPRFNPPTPAWWKRALLILFIVFMFWLYFSLRASMHGGAQSQVIHAHRYA